MSSNDDKLRAVGLLRTWWAMTKAGYELDEGESLRPEQVVLNFSGNGASCFLTVADLDALFVEPWDGSERRTGRNSKSLWDRAERRRLAAVDFRMLQVTVDGSSGSLSSEPTKMVVNLGEKAREVLRITADGKAFLVEGEGLEKRLIELGVQVDARPKGDWDFGLVVMEALAVEIAKRRALVNSLDFAEVWKKYEALGYSYGSDALENTRFGFNIAIDEMKAKTQ